jgi:hypothetical protein
MKDEPAPNSAKLEKLTSIWERVLQRSSIGVRDNFFDLGGDPASANRMFLEIMQGF